jgi:hypothetical protein
MKNIFTILSILILLTFTVQVNAAVNYGLDHDCSTGSLVITVTADVVYPGGGSGSAVWSPYGFTLRWPTSLGTTILGTFNNVSGSSGQFGFAPAGSVEDGGDGYYYQKIAGISVVTFALSSTGVPYTVCTIALTGSSGSVGSFDIPSSTNAWVVANDGESFFSNDQGNQHPTTYSIVSDPFVPVGPGIYYDSGAWCGGSKTNGEPGSGDSGLDCFVLSAGATITYFDGQVNDLTIVSGATLEISGVAGAALVVNGATHIEDPQGLLVSADPTNAGTASLITNGSITYGTGGTAQVQTYIQNAPSSSSLHMHLLGPMVDDPTFTGTLEPAVYLSDFDFAPLETFAYNYLESLNIWQNIYNPSTEIPGVYGIAVSDTTNTDHLWVQEGHLMTGTLQTDVAGGTAPWGLTKTTGFGDGLTLLSNPYPSGLDLNAFTSATGPNIWQFLNSETAYLWQHNFSGGSAPYGNYATWVPGSPGTGTGQMIGSGGYISPGQGFFMQLGLFWASNGGSAPITFNDAMRVPYHAPIVKNEHTNLLRIMAQGNLSADDLLIYFYGDSASGNYDNFDAEKWESMYEGATQISTLSDDGIKLTQNYRDELGSEMVTVPLHFTCGADMEYTLTASEMETFELGSEIYLEDLVTGAPWINLQTDPVYVFNGSPDDSEHRFNLYFFGPTGIDDDPVLEDISAIQIYSYHHDAYIVNRGNEVIEEFVVYDMTGRELQRGTLPVSTVNKVYIGQVSGYYVVKVITNNRIYSEKVFINR